MLIQNLCMHEAIVNLVSQDGQSDNDNADDDKDDKWIEHVCSGPIGAGICYAGCAALVCACFSAAGFTFGTVPGALIAATPALTACNAAFATCEAAYYFSLQLILLQGGFHISYGETMLSLSGIETMAWETLPGWQHRFSEHLFLLGKAAWPFAPVLLGRWKPDDSAIVSLHPPYWMGKAVSLSPSGGKEMPGTFDLVRDNGVFLIACFVESCSAEDDDGSEYSSIPKGLPVINKGVHENPFFNNLPELRTFLSKISIVITYLKSLAAVVNLVGTVSAEVRTHTRRTQLRVCPMLYDSRHDVKPTPLPHSPNHSLSPRLHKMLYLHVQCCKACQHSSNVTWNTMVQDLKPSPDPTFKETNRSRALSNSLLRKVAAYILRSGTLDTGSTPDIRHDSSTRMLQREEKKRKRGAGSASHTEVMSSEDNTETQLPSVQVIGSDVTRRRLHDILSRSASKKERRLTNNSKVLLEEQFRLSTVKGSATAVESASKKAFRSDPGPLEGEKDDNTSST
ncbi:hypothetical protein C0J52_01688 [Blattella germanica]|nr:hypothetical protein C0J52_01688 [Blattella germanica]